MVPEAMKLLSRAKTLLQDNLMKEEDFKRAEELSSTVAKVSQRTPFLSDTCSFCVGAVPFVVTSSGLLSPHVLLSSHVKT